MVKKKRVEEAEAEEGQVVPDRLRPTRLPAVEDALQDLLAHD